MYDAVLPIVDLDWQECMILSVLFAGSQARAPAAATPVPAAGPASNVDAAPAKSKNNKKNGKGVLGGYSGTEEQTSLAVSRLGKRVV